MQKAITEAKKIGGSLMVRIPADAAREEGIEAGDLVELTIQKAKVSGFGMYPDIGPMTREDEMDTHD